MPSKTNVIYLLGAGRSGTTLLATLMHDHSNIHTLGEMHQYFDHLLENKACSCGKPLEQCSFWGQINIFSSDQIKNYGTLVNKKERHSQIPKLLLGIGYSKKYRQIQEELFATIANKVEKTYLLDSSKYIARYLHLKKSRTLYIKGIYLVRDVRGVIHSFGKNVQTPKGPFTTILYYLLINIFGQLVCWLDKDIIKIRYEDLTENPEIVLSKIYTHIFERQIGVEKLSTSFIMPHIIGGNRMKAQEEITINKDVSWKMKIKGRRQKMYYFLTFPLMMINKY